MKGLTRYFLLEAASGFEPLNKGFADLCLTTWLRRHLLCEHFLYKIYHGHVNLYLNLMAIPVARYSVEGTKR